MSDNDAIGTELVQLVERIGSYFEGTVEGRTRMLNATQCDDIRKMLQRMRDLLVEVWP